MQITVKIFPNETGPAGKLCDAELHFDPAHPTLGGLKLIGFAIWERRSGTGRNVTFPSRTYSVNGERRSFALLRPIGDVHSQDAVRDRILAAYADWETQAEQEPAQQPQASSTAGRITEPASRAQTAAGDAGRIDSL